MRSCLNYTLLLAVLACVPALSSGCGDQKGGTGKRAGKAPPEGCSDLPVSQTASEPCCPDLGADACGANLFCEAFDGRTQPTCYITGSRKDGEECRADDHCASASCNLEVER